MGVYPFQQSSTTGQLITCTGAESPEDKFAMSIETSMTLEEVDMDVQLTLSVSKRKNNMAEEGNQQVGLWSRTGLPGFPRQLQ